jgi:hypothetical protein
VPKTTSHNQPVTASTESNQNPRDKLAHLRGLIKRTGE